MLVGIDLIDEQHGFLIALFNTLIDRLNDGLSVAERDDMVGRLFEYTKYHFAAEEQVMASCGYAKRHSHRKQHDAFILNLKDLARNRELSPDDALELAQFLSKWIQHHILVTDKEVGASVSEEPDLTGRGSGLEADVERFVKGDAASAKKMAVGKEIAVHRMWLSGKASVRAELEFRDMSDLNLDAADLSSAALTGVNLAKSSLRGANLSNAVLVGADLEEADLTEANLTGADLRGANLHRALLTAATLRGADLCSRDEAADVASGVPDVESAPTVLTEARLERAVMCSAKLAGCDFTGADMADADLSGADLTGSVMIGADLHGVRFDGAVMAGTVIDMAMLDDEGVSAIAAVGGAVEPSRRELTVEEFVGAVKAHERWIDSGGADGHRLDLDRVTIPAVKMTGRRLAGCRMRRCRILGGEWPGTDFSMSDLSYTDMRGIDLGGGRLRGTTLRRANLAGAVLSSAVLDALPLAVGSRVWPTNLEGANLAGADLSGASLDRAILRRADLRGCVVEGISIRNTDFEG
ncbi:MAG: bacteriohemerythrin, partial [Rhodospirillaceae bacterium]